MHAAVSSNRKRFVVLALALITSVAFFAGSAESADTTSLTTSATTSGSRIIVPVPSGVTPGTVLVAALEIRLDGWRSITAPAGWQLVRRDSNNGVGATLSQAVYVHTAGTSEPSSYTWSFPVSRAAEGTILAVSGIDPANPVDAASGKYTNNSAQIVAPAVTTGAGNELVLGFFGTNGSRGMSVSGMTKVFDKAVGTLVEGAGAQTVQTTAGSTGAKTATEPAANSSNIGQLVALHNAAPTTTTTATSPTPDFAMSATPSGLTLTQGQTGTTTVDVSATSNLTGSVGLSASGLPTGAMASFSAGSISGSGSSQLSVSTSSTTPAGSYVIKVSGADGSLTHTVSVGLTVNSVPIVAPPPPTPSGGYYVATNGSDANPGSIDLPFATIQHALDVAQAGSTIYVRGGTYVGQPVVTRSGTSSAWITLQAYPGEQAVLRPNACGSDCYALQIDGTSYFRASGLTLEYATGTSSADVYVYGGAHDIEISGNEIAYSQDQGIFLDDTTSRVSILRNRIHDNGFGHVSGQHQSHGIYMEGTDHIVADNFIYNQPYGFGIQVYPSDTRPIIANNTVVHNGHSGIVLGGSGGVSGAIVVNNVFADNASWGIEQDATAPTACVVDHNIMWGNSGGSVESGYQGCTFTNNQTVDPLFVSDSTRNDDVQSGSPTIDAGNSSYNYGPAFSGVARPQGAGIDIGAYEH